MAGFDAENGFERRRIRTEVRVSTSQRGNEDKFIPKAEREVRFASPRNTPGRNEINALTGRTVLAARDATPAQSGDGDVAGRRGGMLTLGVAAATGVVSGLWAAWEFVIKPVATWTNAHIITPVATTLAPVVKGVASVGEVVGTFAGAYVETLVATFADPSGASTATWVVLGVGGLIIVSTAYVTVKGIGLVRKVYRYFRPRRGRASSSGEGTDSGGGATVDYGHVTTNDGVTIPIGQTIGG